jgi:hypothetical protein
MSPLRFLLGSGEDAKTQDCYNQVEVFTAKHILERQGWDWLFPAPACPARLLLRGG